MGVLIGIGLPIAISTTALTPNLGLSLACAGFVLQALNFFQGKMATLDDEDYSRLLRARPLLSLLDYVLNMLIVVQFIVIATLISSPAPAEIFGALVRITDVALVLIGLRASFSAPVLRAHFSWLVFDIVSGAAWIGLALYTLFGSPENALLLYGAGYLAISVADLVMDYTYNRKLYFRPPNPWESFTESWDIMQGELGDPIHQFVVVPALTKVIDDLAPARVLDLGSGNGCVARSIAAPGRTVIGMDISESMVAAAESYEPRDGLRYMVGDVRSGAPRGLDPVDCVVSVFSHHDIGDLDAVFTLAADTLQPGGTLVFVLEDLDELERVTVHGSTHRRWLMRARRNEKRSQLVYWRSDYSADTEAVSESTYWTNRAYHDAARRSGFSSATHSAMLQARSLQLHDLRRYNTHPFIRLLAYTYEPEPVV